MAYLMDRNGYVSIYFINKTIKAKDFIDFGCSEAQNVIHQKIK